MCVKDQGPVYKNYTKLYHNNTFIYAGMQVLKELGIEVDVYVSSEIDQDAVKVGNDHLFY